MNGVYGDRKGKSAKGSRQSANVGAKGIRPDAHFRKFRRRFTQIYYELYDTIVGWFMICVLGVGRPETENQTQIYADSL